MGYLEKVSFQFLSLRQHLFADVRGRSETSIKSGIYQPVLFTRSSISARILLAFVGTFVGRSSNPKWSGLADASRH